MTHAKARHVEPWEIYIHIHAELRVRVEDRFLIFKFAHSEVHSGLKYFRINKFWDWLWIKVLTVKSGAVKQELIWWNGGWGGWWDIIRAVVGWLVVGWSTGLVRARSRHIKLWNLKKIVPGMIFQSQLWLLLLLRNFGHNNWFSVTSLFVVRIISLEK